MKELMAKCESCGLEIPIAGWAMWKHGMPSADAFKRKCPRCGGSMLGIGPLLMLVRPSRCGVVTRVYVRRCVKPAVS